MYDLLNCRNKSDGEGKKKHRKISPLEKKKGGGLQEKMWAEKNRKVRSSTKAEMPPTRMPTPGPPARKEETKVESVPNLIGYICA